MLQTVKSVFITEKKRVLALLLAFCLIIGMMPIMSLTAFAYNTGTVASVWFDANGNGSLDGGETEEEYTTFDAAWAVAIGKETTATKKVTVKLIANVSSSVANTINNDYVVFDTNGYTLSYTNTTYNANAFTVAGGELSIIGSGKINITSSLLSAVKVTGGTVNLTNATIKNDFKSGDNGLRGAVHTDGGTFNMYSGTIEACGEYAFYKKSGNINLYSGNIIGQGRWVVGGAAVTLCPRLGETLNITNNGNATNFSNCGGFLAEKTTMNGEGTVKITAASGYNVVNGIRAFTSNSFKMVKGTLIVDISAGNHIADYNGYMYKAFDSLPQCNTAGTSYTVYAGANEKSATEIASPDVKTYQNNEYVKIIAKSLHAHDGITFDNELSAYQATLNEGNYYLTDDITADGSIAVNGTVNLCLNGHKLTMGSNWFSVGSGATLNIYDCNASGTAGGGKIISTEYTVYLTGGNLNMHGGTVQSTSYFAIYNNGTGNVNVSGGTVSSAGNVAIYNERTGNVNVSGGTVSSTSTRSYGITNGGTGNVNVSGGTVSSAGNYAIYNSKGKVYLSGTPTITGGTNGAIYLENKETLVANDGTATPTYYTGDAIIINADWEPNSNDIVVSGVNADNKGKFTLTYVAEGYSLKYDSVNSNLIYAQCHVHDGITFDNELSAYQATLGTAGTTTNYVLTGDFEADGIININGTVNLCLNGHKLNMAGYRYSVGTNATLNIYDCSSPSSGAVVGEQYVIYLNGGNLNMHGGTVSTNGRVIYNNGTGAVNVSGGTVQSTNSSGIYNEGTGTVNVSGGTVSSTSDYAIYNNSTGTVTVSGGTVSSASYYAIHNYSAGDVNVSGGTVQSTNSNAIYNNGTGKVYLSGTPTITGDTDGAIRLKNKGTLFANDGTTNPTYYTGSALAIKAVWTLAVNDIVVSGVNADNKDKFTLKYAAMGYGLKYDSENSTLFYAASTNTVTLNENGGSYVSTYTKPTSYANGTSVNLPTSEQITRANYTFGGWFENGDFTGTPVTAISATDTGDKTYYAKWTENRITGVSASNINAVYDGTAKSISVTGTKTGDTITYKLANGAYSATKPTFTNAQSAVTVYYKVTRNNYVDYEGSATVTINPATDNAITSLTFNGWTFGDTAKTPIATAKYGKITYTYSDRENGTYTSTVPTAAGTYFVKASVTATNDYNACEVTKSFDITAKAIDSKDITLSEIDAYYLFTGSAITPEPTVKYGNVTLNKDTDYTLSYENNIAIGTNAKVKVALKGNYSGSAEKTFEIRYGTMNDTEIKNAITLPDFNSKGWYKEDIVITAKDGFTICKTPTGSFDKTLKISEESTKTGTDYTFYIKADDGSVYQRTLNYKLDKTNPTDIKVQYNTNGFKSFLNTITFGLFFKENVFVSAQATDELSGIAKYQYAVSTTPITDFSDVTWRVSLTLQRNSKQYVYVKAIDLAGNESIINYEGVVVYTDSTQNTKAIEFIKTSTIDVTANVNLNGNTVKEIKNGNNIIADTNYTVSADGKITFKASYLDTLSVGTYTLTVSYNPMGESFVTGTNNQAPSTTSVALAVKAKALADENGQLDSSVTVTATPNSYTYDGKAFAPTVAVTDGTKLLTVGTDYTISWTSDMTNVGEKTATITFNGIYSGTTTKTVNVTNAKMTDTTTKTQSATYNGKAQSITNLPSATTVNNQPVTVKYSTYGTTYDLTSAPSFTNAGDYTVYYQLSAPNHETVTGQIAFTINPATDNEIANLNLNGWTFGDTAKTPTATAKYGQITYTYSDSENGTYTSTVPTKAGTYYVKASVTATNDYNACEAIEFFVITAKAIDSSNITISGIDDYYLFTGGAITPEPTVNVGSVILNKDTDYTLSYENNIAIGTNAKVKVTLKDNYSGSAEKTFEIRYGTMNDTEIKNAITLPEFNSNRWYNKDIDITAKDGFTICKTPTGSFDKTLTISDESTKTGTDYTFYIKADNGSIYERTMNYKLDKTNPTDIKVQYNTNGFKSFLNTITFGLFFKENVDVTAQATDTLSGIAKYQYVASDIELTDFTGVNWQNSLSLTQNSKKMVYVKAIDIAENESIINYEGVVVYTDSTQNTKAIEFIKTSTTDVTANVNLNGNTVKEIKNGNNVIANTNYTVAANGTITFKASYLDTLNVGNYTLTISYNPMDERFVAGGDNQAPSTTSIALAVKAKALADENGQLDSSVSVTATPDSYTYDGKAFAPTVAVTDGTKPLTVDTDYTISWTSDMTNVGEKTATITFKGIYSGTTTKTVNVTNAKMTDTTNKVQSATYNGKAQSITNLPSATTVNNQPVTVKYSADGTSYNLTSAPSFTNAGNYTVYYQLSAPNHETVTGQIAFTINPATDNAIANLTLNDWTFGDTAKTPSATAKYGEITYTYSDRENGTYTSTVPTKAGTYFVKASVKETANYNGCEAIESFAITAKAIDSKDITLSEIDDYYLFTGSAITPEPTVKVGNVTLTKDTDYTLSYENNIAIGTNAKVKVTLKGNYSGSAEKTFKIRYGTIKDEDIKKTITFPEFNSNGWYNKDIVIDAVGGFTLSTTPTGTFGSSLTISDESTKTGTDYTFYIKADNGCIYERTLNYKLDKQAPEGSIVIAKSGLKNLLSSITFGLFFNSDVDVTVADSDTISGIATIEAYKAEKELTKEELANVSWTAYTSAITEKAKDAEQFIYYARITDNAGNSVIVNSDGVTFDTTPPVISGVTNGEIYYTSQKVTATDTELDRIIINEKDFTNGGTISGNTSATYTITATDKAGNSTTYTVTMKQISDISDPIGNTNEDNVKSEDQEKIEEIKKKAQEVNTTNATAEEKKALQDIIDKCDRLLKKIEADKNNASSPQTGDNRNISLWIALLFLSCGVLTTLGISKKRRKEIK